MYIHKIISGLVPNLTDARFNIKFYNSVRSSRLYRVLAISSANARNMVDHSFAVQGP